MSVTNDTGINLELFPCAGGMAKGFKEAGITFDLAIEWMPNHCDSYEANIGHRPVCMDVNDFHRLVKLGLARPRVKLLVADPPCTPWSHAGKRKGLKDERDMLVTTCDLIKLLQPDVFLIGNVPGLDDSKNLGVVQKHIGGLSYHGYCTADFVRLDAADFGVPQHRHRPFWFGHRRDTPCIQWPEPTHGDPDLYDTSSKRKQLFLPAVKVLKPWVTVRQALQHLPPEKIGRLVKVKKREVRDGHPPSPVDGPAMTVKASDGSQYITVNDENHAMSSPDKPGRTITRNTHGDGSVILLNDKHAPTDVDAPCSTIRGGGEGHSAPNTVIMLNDRHPNAELDKPAPTMGAKQRGQGAQVLSLPSGSDMFPPSKPDEPAKALRAAGRTAYIEIPQGERIGDDEQPAVAITTTVPRVKQGADKVLGWPWDRPATTVQADDRIAPPGHHDESFATRSLPNAVVISEEAGALLQGFPPGWKFFGKTKKARWSQIGQAMPPPLAHAVADAVRKQMGIEPTSEESTSTSTSAPTTSKSKRTKKSKTTTQETTQ